jgi:hypothetical protein
MLRSNSHPSFHSTARHVFFVDHLIFLLLFSVSGFEVILVLVLIVACGGWMSGSERHIPFPN